MQVDFSTYCLLKTIRIKTKIVCRFPAQKRFERTVTTGACEEQKASMMVFRFLGTNQSGTNTIFKCNTNCIMFRTALGVSMIFLYSAPLHISAIKPPFSLFSVFDKNCYYNFMKCFIKIIVHDKMTPKHEQIFSLNDDS